MDIWLETIHSQIRITSLQHGAVNHSLYTVTKKTSDSSWVETFTHLFFSHVFFFHFFLHFFVRSEMGNRDSQFIGWNKELFSTTALVLYNPAVQLAQWLMLWPPVNETEGQYPMLAWQMIWGYQSGCPTDGISSGAPVSRHSKSTEMCYLPTGNCFYI